MIARDAELSELFMRVFILRAAGANQPRGRERRSARLQPLARQRLRLREFLSRNGQPYRYVDLDSDDRSQSHARSLSSEGRGRAGRHLQRPERTAESQPRRSWPIALDLNANVDESQVRDLIVVGAGPAGLAAAVYAASEGLERFGGGGVCTRRTGRVEFEDRELSGLSHRHFRRTI